MTSLIIPARTPDGGTKACASHTFDSPLHGAEIKRCINCGAWKSAFATFKRYRPYRGRKSKKIYQGKYPREQREE